MRVKNGHVIARTRRGRSNLLPYSLSERLRHFGPTGLSRFSVGTALVAVRYKGGTETSPVPTPVLSVGKASPIRTYNAPSRYALLPERGEGMSRSCPKGFAISDLQLTLTPAYGWIFDLNPSPTRYEPHGSCQGERGKASASWRRPSFVQVADQIDDVAHICYPVAIGVPGFHRRGPRSSFVEITDQVDYVAHVDYSVSVGISTVNAGRVNKARFHPVAVAF